MTNCKLSQKKIFGPQLSEEEVLDMIQAAPGLYSRYTSLSEQLKDEFLGFCMGTRGLNLTYDPMFKAVFDPQQFPSRLGEFLSLCLGEPVQILKALPTESSRLTEESSLLVMDLLVQLETGALANVDYSDFRIIPIFVRNSAFYLYFLDENRNNSCMYK